MQTFEEIIELIEITGDKCIILHKEQKAYVVMNLNEYKKLAQKEAQGKLKMPENSEDKPDTDVKQYEIPHLRENKDIYYTEPLEEEESNLT